MNALVKYGLPVFESLTPEDFKTAVDTILEENRRDLEACLSDPARYTWTGLLFPLEQMEAKLGDVWHTLSHLNSVKNTAELYKTYQTLLPKLSLYSTEMMQNQKLYKAILGIKNSKQYVELDVLQKKIMDNWLQAFELFGVQLPQEKQEKIKQLHVELSELESRFEQNVLESTHSWTLHITDPAQLKGLPERELAQRAHKEKPGYLLTLDFPCYWSVMTHADDRSVRETLYRAYTTRASKLFDDPKWDNTHIMLDILKKRQALSHFLGFEHYAQYALQTRMLKKTEAVSDFLQELLEKIKVRAEKDFKELQVFAQQTYGIEELRAWDIAYFSEKMLQKTLQLSEEALREYFPLDHVLKGLFSIAKRLYGIQIKEITDFDTWHESVRLFAIEDHDGALRGYFYADLFARSHKQGGAWVANGKARLRNPDNTLHHPVTYLATNFSNPVDGQDSLLSHDEVVTLFHEFGHCLHHTVTTVDYPSISGGSGVEWDAIECPSQLMENWCWEKEALDFITQHVKTQETLPGELFLRLKKYRYFQIGLSLIRQLEYGLLDFALHTQDVLETDNYVEEVLKQIRENTNVIPVPSYNRVSNSFGHVFSGEYAAGYYSYLWSEVLSSDVYACFKEGSDIFDKGIAGRFLNCVLEKGGSKDFLELFEDFRGRKPNTKALFGQLGL